METIYKLKHIESGLFYGATRESQNTGSVTGNLTLNGQLYKKKPNLKDSKFKSVLVCAPRYSTNENLKRVLDHTFGLKSGQQKWLKTEDRDWEIIEIGGNNPTSTPEASGIMKAGDFINLITTYASFFRDQEDKPETDKVLTDFVNFVAANQGVDYGIYAEELANHKRRVYNPVDSDIMLNQVRKIEDFQSVLIAVYQNNPHPHAKHLIEDLSLKYGGEFVRSVSMHKKSEEIYE